MKDHTIEEKYNQIKQWAIGVDKQQGHGDDDILRRVGTPVLLDHTLSFEEACSVASKNLLRRSSMGGRQTCNTSKENNGSMTPCSSLHYQGLSFGLFDLNCIIINGWQKEFWKVLRGCLGGNFGVEIKYLATPSPYAARHVPHPHLLG